MNRSSDQRLKLPVSDVTCLGADNSGPGGAPRTDLRLQLGLLRAAGAWAPHRGPSTSASSLLYDAYSAGVILLLLAFVGSQVSAMLHFWGDILSVTTNACVTFTYTMAIFKLLVVLTMRRSAEHLINELNRCMQEYGRELAGEKASVFAGCCRQARRVVVGHVAIGAVAYVCGVALPAVRGRVCPAASCRAKDGFPVLVWYPFPFTVSPAYELIFAGVSLGFFYGYILSTTLDGFFVTLIIYLSGQLRLLNLMAESMCSAQPAHSRRDVAAPADTSEECVRRRLAQCVRYHTDVDRCVRQLSTLLGPILLGQVLADVVTISATAFVTTTGKTDSGWVFKYGSYLAAIAEQLLLYCWFGNDVLTESERLQLSAYSSQWVGASPRFRRELRLFLCRAHRPLRLTASKFYTISRETFLLLMNASFSYYAVLRQLNSD
ncbi:odorant receptor Or2-like [Schistocerca serialis cubense]|uniref:odorant receptor Or2-like n=1 Tax=Schistocerca serialis cubense TaxID=2023355 RepID=UPI00214E47D6|nr:odorant receptor Or2-like [Schistocerca serialis cubense]